MLNSRRTNFVFNQFLDQQEESAPSERKKLFSRLRERRQLRQLAHEEAFAMYDADLERGFTGGFFQWLIEHADEIFSIIERLIKLFSGV